MKEGRVFDSRNICEFCQLEHADNCSFMFKDTSYKEILERSNLNLRASFVIVAVIPESV